MNMRQISSKHRQRGFHTITSFAATNSIYIKITSKQMWNAFTKYVYNALLFLADAI